jgi:putative autotransporter adhesin-like protein
MLLLIAIVIALVVDRIFFPASSSSLGTGSGVAATQARPLPPFTGVELAGDNNVIVRVGARQSVLVHADSNLLRRVTTRVRSGSLVIGTTPGNLSARSPMFVVVSLPSLDRITLRGDGNFSVAGVHSRSLTVALPGSGNIEATGTATKLVVTIAGEGTALLRRLVSRDAKAVLDGDGSIMLTATHSLAARISGSGTILYNGTPPHVSRRVTGNGTIGAG